MFSEIVEVRFHQACCVIMLIHGHWLHEEAVIRGSASPKTVQMKKLPCTLSSEPLPMSLFLPRPLHTAHLFELALTRSRPHSEERLVKVIRPSLSSLL